MSINIYARQAPIHDACGRADYISNSRRQENLLAVASTSSRPDYWQILSADAQTAYRQAGGKRQNGDEGTRACEAREIHLQLPNSALERMTADQLAKKIANDFKSKYGVECMVAIHYNKTKSNLHCHILFGERQLLQEPEIRIAERNVFIGSDGIRKRTKKEILDTDGNLLPGCSIVKKGEVLSARYFGDKNLMFEDKAWMDEYRRDMANWINENLKPDKLRTVYDRKGPYLAQKHIGKGVPAAKRRALEEWNKWVKQFNNMIDTGYISKEEALDYKTRIMLSPDQNTEIKAVIAELGREIAPKSEHRQGWDRAAALSAKAPLSTDVKNRQEKQELRDLYKAQGAARIQLIDACTDKEEDAAEAKLDALSVKVKVKKERLGFTPDQLKLRELGRLAGVKPAEVDRLYQEAPKMTGQQWKEVWGGCKAAQTQFWNSYRDRRQALHEELDDAYKRRKRVKDAKWLLDPRNRRAGLLGIVYAAIVLSKSEALWQLDDEIAILKKRQAELRRQVQQFKAATEDTYATLHTRGLDPDEYLATVKRMQQIADRTFAESLWHWRTRDAYFYEDQARAAYEIEALGGLDHLLAEHMKEMGATEAEIQMELRRQFPDSELISGMKRQPEALEDLIAGAESNSQEKRPRRRRTWDGADENDGGFSGER